VTPAEKNRDRILAAIDKILRDAAYKAPERIRSELYAFMVEEFAKCEAHMREKLK
jgi:hypothetical protein